MRALSVAAMVVLSLVAPRLGAQPSPTAITDHLQTRAVRPIDFHAAVFPDTVWVGQQATYQVAVLLNSDARNRLRRNPEFLPPELRGLLAYELGSPTRVPPKSYGADVYEAHVFQRALFAVAPGTLVVPSPQLTYSLPQSASYFSREERNTVAAESVTVVVKPLPEEGRPADFNGATGVFRVSARLDAAAARMGDPLVLTVRIEGIGNVKLLPRPTVEVSWASTVAGTERVSVDSSGSWVRGAKEFEFILTPTQSGSVIVPVIHYPYFDPFKGQYAVASSSPADLTVADGSVVTNVGDPDDGDLLPLRPWSATLPRQWDRLPLPLAIVLVLVVAGLPVAAIGTAIWQRRRPSTVVGTASDAPRTATVSEPDITPGSRARQLRRTVVQRLVPRLQVAPADLVLRADLQQVLRRRGVSRDTTRAVVTLLDELAQVGFGPQRAAVDTINEATGVATDFDISRAEAQAETLLQRVDAEAVTSPRTRVWSRRRRTGSLLLLLASSGIALAAAGHDAEAQAAAGQPTRAGDASASDVVANSEAVAAYQSRRFTTATVRYAELVATRPTDIDLLVNWGTAAWAANDTVSAVVAWQRAARLDPFAQDIQQRLTMLPAGARTGVADVPMVPVLPLVVVALLLWCVGWSLLWWCLRPGATEHAIHTRRNAGVAFVALAVIAGGVAWWGHQTLDVANLAVVRRPEPLRTSASAEAAPQGGTATGDVVHIVASSGEWMQVVHADGRRGWLPVTRIERLTAPLLAADRTR